MALVEVMVLELVLEFDMVLEHRKVMGMVIRLHMEHRNLNHQLNPNLNNL